MTVDKFMETTEVKAITVLINYKGTQDWYTSEEMDKLSRDWGLEEVSSYHMMNTREMVINIK